MPIIQTQTFAFAPPQQGVSEMTQSNPITGVYLDGSQSITVPFPTPFAQYVKSVNVQYTPAGEVYPIDTAVQPIAPATSVALSLSGFVLTVTGGPPNTTDNFTYTAEGL